MPHRSSVASFASHAMTLPGQSAPAHSAPFDGTSPPRLPPEHDGVPWARYLDVLKRHLLLVIALTAAGSAAGVLLSRRIDPLYEAQATIWISGANGQGGPIRVQQNFSSISWTDLLRSFAIVDPVVRSLKLNVGYNLPADSALFRSFETTAQVRAGSYVLHVARDNRYVLTTHDGAVVERGALGDSVGRTLGFRWLPQPGLLSIDRPVSFTVSTPRNVSLGLVSRMRSTLPEGGQFLTLSLSGSNAELTARTVNAWAEQFVAASTDLKKRHLIEFRTTLGEQLALSEGELHAAEIQLEQFRVNTITLPSSGSPVAGGVQATRDPVFLNYFQQKATAEEVRNDRRALERMLAEAQGAPLNTQAFLGLPSVLNNTPQLRSAIEELSSRQAALRSEQQYLTDSNPRIRQLTEAVHVLEYQTIPRISESVLASLREREKELDSRIVTQSAELRAIPPRTIEEMRLLRQVLARENLYNSLKSRYEEVSLSEAETSPDVSILDYAVAPLRPGSNDSPRIVLLGVIGSLAIAVLIALLHDRMDPRFRYPEQATHELGLTIAGTMPKLRIGRRGHLDDAAMSQAVESMRGIRLAVRYEFNGAMPVVLSVSSPGIGDGKSLLSSNLALTFASAGHRTLLIDGDVRRGSQHTTFDVPVEPGLVEFLQGRADEDAVVKSTASPNLFLLPCGKRRTRAPELLVSDRMQQLVAAMRERFDVVIIDCPPFVAGVDAYALGAAAGNMLVVLRHGQTDRKLAAAKLEVMDRLPVRLLGVVLNGVSNTGMYRYYGNDPVYSGKTGHGSLGDLATPRGLVLRA